MPPEAKKTYLDQVKQWERDLACPVCFARLRFEQATVVCDGCGRIYPVVDDIPVLIPERASAPSKN